MNSTTVVAVIQVFGDDELRCEDVLRAFEKELSVFTEVSVRLEYGGGGGPVAGRRASSARLCGPS